MTADDEQEGAGVGTHCALLPGYGAIPEEGLEVKANTHISTNVFANESMRLFTCGSLSGHAVSSTTSRLSRDHPLSHESAIAPCSCLSRPQQESNGKAGKQQSMGSLSNALQQVCVTFHKQPSPAVGCVISFTGGSVPSVCLSGWGAVVSEVPAAWTGPCPQGMENHFRSNINLSPSHPQNLQTSRHHNLALLKQHSIWDHSTRL